MLRLAVLAFLIVVVQGHAETHKAQQSTNSNQPTNAAPLVAVQQTSSPELKVEKKNHVDADVRVIEAPAKDRYDRGAFWINFSLAVIGLIGVAAAFMTLRKVERQTVATEDASKAALQGSLNVMSAERAWMIPRISQPEYNDVMFPDEKEDDWKLPIQVEITNLGKTPAVAINAAFNYYSVEIADATGQTLMLDLPESPAYSHEPTPYAPGAIYVSGEATSLPLGIPKSFLLAERAAWAEKRKCLCLRGYIKYVDAFKNPHITRFCYAYQEVWTLKAMRYEIRNERGPEFEFRKVNPGVYNEMT